MKRLRDIALIALGAGLVFYGTDWLLNAWRMQRIPKNASVVKPNVLYRSGQLRPEHFQQLLERFGIKTVVCFNPDSSNGEAKLARRLGVRYVELPMPGSGQGRAEQFHEYLQLLTVPANRPVLIHCAAGAYRTGAAVALYRLVFDGWALEDAVAEMKYSGFAGQQDLIDHVQATLETIPASFRDDVATLEIRARERF